MPHRGRTTAILLATGAVVVVVVGVLSFWGDIVWFFQSDVERIQGRWKVVSVIFAGQGVPESALGHFIFDGEKMTVSYPDGGKVMREYRLDENHQPGWFDITQPDDKSQRGIYEINSDTLRICTSTEERPATFEPKAGDRLMLWVSKRE